MDQATIILVLAALLANSELLALIPSVKANSNFQMIVNFLKTVYQKLVAAQPPKSE